jgi:hypothetical protein
MACQKGFDSLYSQHFQNRVFPKSFPDLPMTTCPRGPYSTLTRAPIL